MRLKVLILRDTNNKPLASVAEVQAVVDKAVLAYRASTNIRIVPPLGQDEIVEVFDSQNPTYVLKPKCDKGGYGEIFTRIGRWFRDHSYPYSFRGGATIFIVENVLEKGGCFLGPPVDYGYLDGSALRDPGPPEALATGGRKLTLAHELGHACDLRHRKRDQSNLMAPMQQSATGEQRTTYMTRWQQSVVRSSARVRYF